MALERFLLRMSRADYKKNVFPIFEFHIAAKVRKLYDFQSSMFSLEGNLILADFQGVRDFVFKVNKKRPEAEKLSPGQVNCAGLLDEIFHFLLREYEQTTNPGVFEKAIQRLESKIGPDNLNKLLFDFTSAFPPKEVYTGRISVLDYLGLYLKKRSAKAISIEELMLLYLDNFNPANAKIRELFSEDNLEDKGLYQKSLGEINSFFKSEPVFGPKNEDLMTMLMAPILSHPNDIEAQIEYIMENWKLILPDKLLKRLKRSKDLLREDYGPFMGGPAPTVVPTYKTPGSDQTIGRSGYKYGRDSYKFYMEEENFTPDSNWMPRVVLLAKNAYVWLDQLSKEYRRPIVSLGDVPDQELDKIKSWNFNGLWLIGIWERSTASKRIKHILGNIDAAASAYSLYGYNIAHDLGGEEAYQNLNERCKIRGIRLASDMVPNHTGIYSDWIINHPEYFIQTEKCPFPNYSFSRENLSDDWRVQLRLEDGYYSRTDAAVVFQRIDSLTGKVTYIYHGNDGTNMPWNDTAQLNLLKKEVREAVINQIMDVARRFSIIRFDAAMTLAKKHFERLWYPEPGQGGDIPTRSDYAMTREQFDSMFPEEFWREVVDRINREMPDTLLLAEAFWLMEGYFVRTLGMHRVYNSAFMHMLKNEENEKYRDLITNTLEFEPEILKRYVNFMSNPDEETAIRQFGTDDKYFGVCVLMVTLPGLPMFAHGQIEGYTEKYGMEYRRAYYKESPNQFLVERHQREIFPLMKKRYLFSGVENFWLFDFFCNGYLNENVFAYVNSVGNERALVFFNNKYDSTFGHIYRSASKLTNGHSESRTITDVLGMNTDGYHYYTAYEHISGLEYIFNGKEIAERGFAAGLNGFKYRVYLGFKEILDDGGKLFELCSMLNGKGVESVELELRKFDLRPVHEAYRNLLREESLESMTDSFVFMSLSPEKEAEDRKFLVNKCYYFLNESKKFLGLDVDPSKYVIKFENELDHLKKLNLGMQHAFPGRANKFRGTCLLSGESPDRNNLLVYGIYLVNSILMDMLKNSEEGEACYEKLMLEVPVSGILARRGLGPQDDRLKALLICIMMKQGKKTSIYSEDARRAENLLSLLEDPMVREFLGVNSFENVLYYSKEQFDELMDWMLSLSLLGLLDEDFTAEEFASAATKLYDLTLFVKRQSSESGYRLFELRLRIQDEFGL